jgi:hypothetical protein
MGEKENPWIRLGHEGSISGRFNRYQKLKKMTATAMQIKTLNIFIKREIIMQLWILCQYKYTVQM